MVVSVPSSGSSMDVAPTTPREGVYTRNPKRSSAFAVGTKPGRRLSPPPIFMPLRDKSIPVLAVRQSGHATGYYTQPSYSEHSDVIGRPYSTRVPYVPVSSHTQCREGLT